MWWFLTLTKKKVALMNDGRSPIEDAEFQRFLDNKSRLSFRATVEDASAYEGADFIIIATPTDYDTETNYFDTSSIETVVKRVMELSTEAVMAIKSTVPVEYTVSARERLGTKNLVFSPEFLREGRALYDCLHSSRIVVGEKSDRVQRFADLLLEGARSRDASVLLTGSTEAEAIKLFANTYLGMRVAYFNELNTFSVNHGLDARQIIDGVGPNLRVGRLYSTPNFTYGSYCLPKDSKQLLATYQDAPQMLNSAIVQANSKRKDFIAGEIIKRKQKMVDTYRLAMEADSNNCSPSSIRGMMRGREICSYLKPNNREKAGYMMASNGMRSHTAEISPVE